jgi:hypothetical protein
LIPVSRVSHASEGYHVTGPCRLFEKHGLSFTRSAAEPVDADVDVQAARLAEGAAEPARGDDQPDDEDESRYTPSLSS